MSIDPEFEIFLFSFEDREGVVILVKENYAYVEASLFLTFRLVVLDEVDRFYGVG